jgi:hypothetical protein
VDDRNLDMWGPGIVLQPDNFGGSLNEEPGSDDRFAERQDALHRLNVGLAGADTEASELLSIVAKPDDYDFSAEVEKLFRERRDETLKGLRHPTDRGDAIHDFEELTRRYMDRALAMNLDRRVQSRAAGAERALGRIAAAAIADPDGLLDRLRDADMLLGRWSNPVSILMPLQRALGSSGVNLAAPFSTIWRSATPRARSHGSIAGCSIRL